MKLDTSSYYPKSPLDDDPGVGVPVEVSVQTEAECLAPVETGENVVALGNAGGSNIPEVTPLPDKSFFSKLSHFLSWVLVPLLMPVYGVMIAFGLSILAFTGFGTRLAFTAVVLAFNVVIPAIIVLLLKRMGAVKDIGLNNREERFIPYLVCIICLVGTAIFMDYKKAPTWLVMFFYGGAATGVVEVIVNHWWKISVHAAGIAGIVGLLLHMLMDDYCSSATEIWLLVSIALAGMLGSARIWLGRHTLMQVLAGYAVGFCSIFFITMIGA